MALYFLARREWREKHDASVIEGFVREAISNLAEGMVGNWVSRFDEIEWIIQIWLNWVVSFGEHVGLKDLWPSNKLERFFWIPNLTLDFVVSMGWDTGSFVCLFVCLSTLSLLSPPVVCWWLVVEDWDRSTDEQ